jgi:hypothetical protein
LFQELASIRGYPICPFVVHTILRSFPPGGIRPLSLRGKSGTGQYGCSGIYADPYVREAL